MAWRFALGSKGRSKKKITVHNPHGGAENILEEDEEEMNIESLK